METEQERHDDEELVDGADRATATSESMGGSDDPTVGLGEVAKATSPADEANPVPEWARPPLSRRCRYRPRSPSHLPPGVELA